MRELKHMRDACMRFVRRRTPPGVRELKRKVFEVCWSFRPGRTPPGVRELKQGTTL